LIAGSGVRTPNRRSHFSTSNKVSTIARHFDRLSKDVERDRQRRVASARGRRARPVALTRAKVSVYDNVKDAFRDDDEEESDGADDEADEGDVEGEGEARKPESPSSLPGDKPEALRALAEPEASPAFKSASSSPPVQIKPSPPGEPNEEEEFAPSSLPASEAATEISLKDRLQITLPPFDTTTPLMSMPPTPNLQAIQEPCEKLAGQLSESEVSSGGPERSTILKTLSGLWAFRAGDMSPLEYPL
jgi:1-phosphatidylinositol-3-phosphate 5-kinase